MPSSILSGGSRRSHHHHHHSWQDSPYYQFYLEYMKGGFFGVSYALVKENSFNWFYTVAGFVLEFIFMVILCFRNAFHWGGINFDYNFNNSVIGYVAWEAIFWVMFAIYAGIVLAISYLAYSFHKGEIKSVALLKVARLGTVLIQKVLYLPLLYFVFSGLACDYSTSPASLLLYPSHACWGSRSFITIIAIVFAFVFIVNAITIAGVFFEVDPNMSKSCGRIQNRFEVLANCVKLVLVAVTVFLMDHPQAFIAVSFVSAAVLFLAVIAMLPFYNHKLNLLRSGFLAGVLWVNIWMVISYVMDDDDSLVSIIAATCGIPLAFAGGAFAADRRFKYLCDPTLVDGYISSSEEMEDLPAKKAKKSTKKVNWEKPKTNNKLMKNKLYARLWFSWDVEIAARFVLTGKPNASVIEKAKAVYQTGLSKFPKSTTVLQGYANFLFTTVGDWQLGYAVLEKLRKMFTLIDMDFFIYRYDKDRERRTEGGSDKIGDFVNFMEYKKMMQDARRHHQTSLVSVRKFWHYLLEPKVDVMKLSILSNKIAMAEKKASEHYTKLLTSHPKNVRILRDYARFLEEVALDEHSAREVRKKADKYEIEEMEQLTASHRSSSHQPEPVEADKSDNDSKSHDRSDLDSYDATTISSKSSGIRTQLLTARLDKNNTLKKLGYIMLGTTLLAMAVGFMELGVLNSQLSNFKYAVDAQNSAAGTSQVAARVTRGIADAYSIGMYAERTGNTSYSTMWGGDFNNIVATATNFTIMCGNCMRSLYYGTSDPQSFKSHRSRTLAIQDGDKLRADITDHLMNYDEFDHKMHNKAKVRSFFNSPSYDEILYITKGNSITRSTQVTDIWTLGSLFVSYALQLATTQLGSYSNASVKFISENGFIFENSPVIASGMHDLIVLFSDDISSSLNGLQLTVMIVFIVGGVLLIVGAVTIFRPTVQKIFAAKVRTFSMFTLIPSSVVKIMSKKRVISMNVDSEEEEEEEEQEEIQIDNAPMLRRNSNAFPKWKGKDIAPPEEITVDVRDGVVLHTPRAPQISDERNLLAASDSIDGNLLAASGSVNGNLLGSTGFESRLVSAPSTVSDYFDSGSKNNYSNEETKQKSGSMASSIDLTTKPLSETTITIPENDASTGEPSSAVQTLKRKFSGIAISLSSLAKSNYKKLSNEEEGEEEKKKAQKRSQSRLDVSSLRAVTRKLHLSYTIGLVCIFVALVVSFAIMRRMLQDLEQISTDLEKGGFRTQYANLVIADVTLYALYPRNSDLAENLITNFERDFADFVNQYTEIAPKDYQMDLLYSENCVAVNRYCPQPGDQYYDKTNSGLEFLYFQTIMLAQNLHSTYKSNSTISVTNPDYIQFRYMAEYMLDGMERLLYMVYVDAMNKITSAKHNIAIIVSVECAVFILIYIILFRPFVKQLREETEHTFSLIRMIPRKLLKEVPEIQEFIQETLEDD